jgi:hypothetical protein
MFRDQSLAYSGVLLEALAEARAAGRVLVVSNRRLGEGCQRAAEGLLRADREIELLRQLLGSTLDALETLMRADITVTGYTDSKDLTRARRIAENAVKAGREEIPG